MGCAWPSGRYAEPALRFSGRWALGGVFPCRAPQVAQGGPLDLTDSIRDAPVERRPATGEEAGPRPSPVPDLEGLMPCATVLVCVHLCRQELTCLLVGRRVCSRLGATPSSGVLKTPWLSSRRKKTRAGWECARAELPQGRWGTNLYPVTQRGLRYCSLLASRRAGCTPRAEADPGVSERRG